MSWRMNRKGLLAGYVVDFYVYLAFVFFALLFFLFVAQSAGEPVEVQAVQNKNVMDGMLLSLGGLSMPFDNNLTVADAVVLGKKDIDTRFEKIRVAGIELKVCKVVHRVRSAREAKRMAIEALYIPGRESGLTPSVLLPLSQPTREGENSAVFNLEVTCP